MHRPNRETSLPRLHLFVCANRRVGSVLGPGCGDHGDAVYDALKAEVARRGLVTDTWVTKTFCLGVCPKEGATVARYAPSAPAIFADVVPEDAPALLDLPEDADPIERELLALEELHTKKVLDLARRLKPGLTLEDVRNPHDFPELDDPDWHYADGMLSGIKAARVTVRATRNRNG